MFFTLLTLQLLQEAILNATSPQLPILSTYFNSISWPSLFKKSLCLEVALPACLLPHWVNFALYCTYKEKKDVPPLFKGSKEAQIFVTQSTCIILEYHSAWPLVRIGTLPHPLSRKRVCHPPPPQTRGVGKLVCVKWGGGGPQKDEWRKKPVIFVKSV